MLRNEIKRAVFSLLRKRREIRGFRGDTRRDNAMAARHPEWVQLTAEEKAGLRDTSYGAYTAFKNIRGKLEDGMVSDALYKTKILPVLNPTYYTEAGTSIGDVDTFGNKNYFELMLQHMHLPEAVLRYENGTFLGGDYRLLSGQDEALEVISQYDRLVFKPSSGTGHGTGVALIQREDFGETLKKYSSFTQGGGGVCRSEGPEAA